MILRNYYKILAGKMLLNTSYDELPCKVVYTNGQTADVYDTAYATGIESAMSKFATSASGTNATGIHIGKGITEATFDDYCMDNRIDNSNFTGTVTKTVTGTEDGFVITSLLNIVNTSSESFTISEIGASQFQKTATSGGFAYFFERSLLETPITLAPNEIAQITYTIEHKIYQG